MDTNIAEKVERYNEVGQVVRVTLRWRGKIYYLQMFFPGSKFPSRGEVETQVKKIYPDAVVMIHYASETQPNQPLIRVAEERDEYGDPVGGPKISKKEKEKNLKKNEKDEDHTTTTNESSGVKRDQNMPYVPNQKLKTTKDPIMTSDVLSRYRKNVVLSYEPEGDQLDENEALIGGINKAANFVQNTKNPILRKVFDVFKVKGGRNLPTKNEYKNKVNSTQTNSHELEGEVIKEEEKENPTFVQFMKRIDQLPEVTREAIKNCGNDPAIAKAALEISGIDK
jgi:hypothetical protein